MITVEDVREAHNRIRPFIHATPLVRSRSLSTLTGAEVFIKAENLQKTGAFKVRGAFNKMSRLRATRVITASMGNHAQAVAFAAREMGIEAKIVMPVTVPIVKEEASRSYGADVVLHGENLGESLAFAMRQEGYAFIHPFDDDQVIAGQGTIALEIMANLREVDSLLVPVGGGGLIAGLAAVVKAISPRTEVIGVVAEAAPSALRSFKAGSVVSVRTLPSLADGIAVEQVGVAPFKIMEAAVDDIIAVKEDEIALAILLLMERTKLVVEGAGAVPLAACLSNRERFKGKRIVLLASGGNIDFTVIDRIVRRGLVTQGRIAVIEAVVDDLPGSLHHLTGIISEHRANILDVTHNRLSHDLPVGKTLVSFSIEVRSKDDLRSLVESATAGGFSVKESGLRDDISTPSGHPRV